VTQQASQVRIHRHNGGAPILSPGENGWESGVTFNAAVEFLDAGRDRALVERLVHAAGAGAAAAQDLVAVLYRARPKSDPGYLMNRSYVGLALFDAELKLIHRFPRPVLGPDAGKTADDYLGTEDPRVTRVGEKFVMVYCGCGEENGSWRATLCTAESSDLVNWRKTGPMEIAYGDLGASAAFDPSYFDNLGAIRAASGHVNNKDGVLFPDQVDGWYYFLHRPMVGHISTWAIHLARSRSLAGPWEDLGPIMRARPNTGWVDAWIGAGAVPIALGNGRYLEIYHVGHRAADGSRMYTLGAAVMDLGRLDPSNPREVVTARLDHFMSPQTKWEIEGPYPDSVGNVVFACGAYERGGEIHILYGGGDTYIMAASVAKAELLGAMERVPPGAPL
jgi:beta-1,2-mannobiose phosphorylase / 1,2-beta-oligomannan phosphorylase